MIAYHPTVAISRKQFDKRREEIRIYKETDDFKRKLEEVQNEKNINAMPSSTSIGDNLGNGCSSAVPCYDQYKGTYNNKDARTGCAPNALAMVYGYYDLNGKSLLIALTAPTKAENSNYPVVIQNLQNTLRTKME